MKAETLIKKLRADAERQREQEREISESVISGLVAPICEAGLVDDVEPTGAPIPVVPMLCNSCGQSYPEDTFPPCPGCGNVMVRFG